MKIQLFPFFVVVVQYEPTITKDPFELKDIVLGQLYHQDVLAHLIEIGLASRFSQSTIDIELIQSFFCKATSLVVPATTN
ncbi:hypothetical protein FGO68_gene9273 [Halteria grandinella]|uniref:Uncharacterized protein n=1 Tax=Halteria grandinella TaxID=5974 RepID=A0A8J8P6U5_HALGN|nr:hypothetical protein FGO68_gene9273 [Halteria grandinella]